jgi:hypothetical protein
VGNDLAAIFTTKKVKRQIGEQEAGVNSKHGWNRFYYQGRNQKSTKDKRGVFRNRKTNSSQEEENEQPNIGKVFNVGYQRHGRIELSPPCASSSVLDFHG